VQQVAHLSGFEKGYHDVEAMENSWDCSFCHTACLFSTFCFWPEEFRNRNCLEAYGTSGIPATGSSIVQYRPSGVIESW
jgi:hypothetical protein